MLVLGSCNPPWVSWKGKYEAAACSDEFVSRARTHVHTHTRTVIHCVSGQNQTGVSPT